MFGEVRRTCSSEITGPRTDLFGGVEQENQNQPHGPEPQLCTQLSTGKTRSELCSQLPLSTTLTDHCVSQDRDTRSPQDCDRAVGCSPRPVSHQPCANHSYKTTCIKYIFPLLVGISIWGKANEILTCTVTPWHSYPLSRLALVQQPDLCINQ